MMTIELEIDIIYIKFDTIHLEKFDTESVPIQAGPKNF